MFHQLVQQAVQAYGPEELAELQREFIAGDFSIRKLAVDIMAASAAATRKSGRRRVRTIGEWKEN